MPIRHREKVRDEAEHSLSGRDELQREARLEEVLADAIHGLRYLLIIRKKRYSGRGPTLGDGNCTRAIRVELE